MPLSKHGLGVWAALLCIAAVGVPAAEEAGVLRLPPPSETSGTDLFEALRNRKTTRSFERDKPLPPQTLSDILWAALGKNRDDGKRTIPFSHNRRVIDLYVGTKDGCHLYDADNHRLVKVSDADVRADLFMQQEFHRAPVALMFVFNPESLPGDVDMDGEMHNACMSLGAAMQNVGLAAAAMDLASVAVVSIRAGRIQGMLGLSDGEKLLLAMPVAYPK